MKTGKQATQQLRFSFARFSPWQKHWTQTDTVCSGLGHQNIQVILIRAKKNGKCFLSFFFSRNDGLPSPEQEAGLLRPVWLLLKQVEPFLKMALTCNTAELIKEKCSK